MYYCDMLEESQALGADAVVNGRYFSSSVMQELLRSLFT